LPDDDDDNYYECDDDDRYLADLDEVANCKCGAKKFGSDGRLTYVADCCC
jgi:hypothetical protein